MCLGLRGEAEGFHALEQETLWHILLEFMHSLIVMFHYPEEFNLEIKSSVQVVCSSRSKTQI